MQKFKVFISYAHKDKSYFDIFLANLRSQCDWDIWTDRNIEIGSNWFESIQQSMQQSDAAILLISPDFLSSEFIKENEFNKFNQLLQTKPSFVFLPVFLRDCTFARWTELSKLQMFVSYGDEYGIADKKGQLIPFAKLCRFDNNGQMVPNDNIDTYIKNLVVKVETELNIAKAHAGEAGNNTGKETVAKEIDKLRSEKNIFISLPASEDGNDIRKNFIFTVDGKIKYDTPKWPYEIAPGINQAREIYEQAAGDPEKLVAKLPDKFIYSILIIGAPEDIKTDMFNKQYQLAKQSNAASGMNHTILWFLNPAVKEEIESLDEQFKIELKMLPTIVGTDARSIFKMVEAFDAEREKKIRELTTPYSPVKKVYMFYDYAKDNENELRIKLKKKIQEDKKYAVRDLSYDTIENEKSEIEECNGAVIFYGSNSDSVWYKMRERIVLKAKNIKCGAVCVDGKEEPEIEYKIDRDVNVAEILQIKGEKELDNGISVFKTKLQDN
jgi:hypothetical protein